MDINLNVTLNAPELSAAINNLAGAMLNGAPLQVAAESDKPVRTRSNKKNETAAADKQEPVSDPNPVKSESAPEKKVEEKAAAGAPAPEEKITLENVRLKMRDLAKAGHKEAMQDLIKSFGVDKLSEITEDHYAELMAKAAEIG